MLVAGLRYAFAEATAEGLWLQVGALLLELGVLSGERRLLVLGDGASWIRTWFEGLGIAPKAMIVCWWHLRKRCYESMSTAGWPQGPSAGLGEGAAGSVVGREGGRGDGTAAGGVGVGADPESGRGLDRLPGEASRVHPRLPGTAAGGSMDREHAGGEVQRLGGVGALQAPWDELVAAGGAGLGRAAMASAMMNTLILKETRHGGAIR